MYVLISMICIPTHVDLHAGYYNQLGYKQMICICFLMDRFGLII